jgi:ascorbate-specific PTS system EIIC-type component UlaA
MDCTVLYHKRQNPSIISHVVWIMIYKIFCNVTLRQWYMFKYAIVSGAMAFC